MKTLGVIVPFYNEEQYLQQSVDRLVEQKVINQIVLVNDCSTDNSFKIAEYFSTKYDYISLISTDFNSGKGSAVHKGLSKINTSHVIVHDADLEYFPEDIPEMFLEASINTNTLIIGSRTIGNKIRKSKYKRTFYAQKVFSFLFSILNKIAISDIASCYWLIETSVLRDFNLREKGFGIEIEVLSKAVKQEMKIIEIPINYNARSYREGKKIKASDGIRILLKIVSFSKLFSFFGSGQAE